MASQRIDMLLQNGINDVKVFSASKNVMEAFARTDIGLTVTLPNENLKLINSSKAAEDWIENRITTYVKQGVKIRYVMVGAEPYSTMFNNKTYYEAVDALNFVQLAIENNPELGGGSVKTKATMSYFTDILNDATKPSEADFRGDIKDLMIRTIKVLNDHHAPIWLDIFPIYNVQKRFHNDIEFAFFENNSTSKFMDGRYKYNNVFEVMIDLLVNALEKAGFPDLKIVAGRVGWPTDGIKGANIPNAERFHKGFLKFLASNKGTPRRPGPIDAYVHNLADENRKNISYGVAVSEDASDFEIRCQKIKGVSDIQNSNGIVVIFANNMRLPINQGDYVRHWGVYRFDGTPKYNIDFMGQGRDIKPVSAKGITHMLKRWCIFNNKTDDLGKVKKLFDDACFKSDCTSLAPGGSCGDLAYPRNISYAFNMLFQMRSQKVSEEGCQYGGLGVIVPDDPSTQTCSFPVEILSAEVIGGNGIMNSSASQKMLSVVTILPLLLIMFSHLISYL